MKKEWREINGYEGLYKISNLGEVKSIKKGIILKDRISNCGYIRVVLCKCNNRKAISVHRLVAKNFIDNPKEKPDVNHIDGNKKNNKISNLEWVTKKENSLHSFKIGLQKPQKGINHGMASVSEGEVILIRKLKGELKQKTIAWLFNMSTANISRIMNRKLWDHI